MSDFLHKIRKHRGVSPAPGSEYLKYHDVTLTYDDVESLKYDWLTDNLISFWEEYLHQTYLKTPTHKHTNIRLLPPGVAQVVKYDPNPGDLGIETASHIFVPVNDASQNNASDSGTHWTLLLISVIDGVAFHYDSLNSDKHKNHALLICQRLGKYLNKPLSFVQLEDSPHQENSSDCGVFVCLTMRHLLVKRLLQVPLSEKVSMSMGGRRVDAKEGRKEMAKLIDGFKKNGPKRPTTS